MRRAALPLLLALVAVAWTWPAAVTAGPVGRHFDLLGTLWFIDAAPRVFPSMQDTHTAWPQGANYLRADSWVMLSLAWALSDLPAWALHNGIQVVGVWTSAWAAAVYAQDQGAAPRWAALAGLTFACTGPAATALLEGHVYVVVQPWLPLLALSWRRACGPEGTVGQGVAAGLFWAVGLLSSAYIGLSATLIAVGIWLGAWGEGRPRVPPSAAALGVALAVGLPYIGLFTLGLAVDTGDEHRLQYPLSDLIALAPPVAQVDLLRTSQSLALPATALALALAAPVVLGRAGRWRLDAAIGGLALLLAVGPALSVGNSNLIPLPAALIEDLPGVDHLRFPARLGWVSMLSLGVVAAQVATALEARLGRVAWPLLGLALLDSFLWQGMPTRQRTQLAGAPSAYAGEGPVLDLVPDALNPADHDHMRLNNTFCFYQITHQRPIANDCATHLGDSHPQVVMTRRVRSALLEGDDAGPLLSALGFTAVALHPDLFHRDDRARLEAGLRRLDPHPARSTDGGEHLLVFEVSP